MTRAPLLAACTVVYVGGGTVVVTAVIQVAPDD